MREVGEQGPGSRMDQGVANISWRAHKREVARLADGLQQSGAAGRKVDGMRRVRGHEFFGKPDGRIETGLNSMECNGE